MHWYTKPDRTTYVGTYRTVQELRQEAHHAQAYGWQLVSVIRVPAGLQATFARTGGTS